jgi:hypothetical protein
MIHDLIYNMASHLCTGRGIDGNDGELREVDSPLSDSKPYINLYLYLCIK